MGVFKQLVVVYFMLLSVEASKLHLGKLAIKINAAGLEIPNDLKFGNGRCHSYGFLLNITVTHPGIDRKRVIAKIRIEDDQGNRDLTGHSLTIYKGENVFAIRVKPRVCFCTIKKDKVTIKYKAWLKNKSGKKAKLIKDSSDVPRDEKSVHPTDMCDPMPTGSDPYLDRKVKFEAYSEQFDYWTAVDSELFVGNPGKEGICVLLAVSAEIGTTKAPPSHACQRKFYVPPNCEMKKKMSCDVIRTTFPEKRDRELTAYWIAKANSTELRWHAKLEETKRIFHIMGL